MCCLARKVTASIDVAAGSLPIPYVLEPTKARPSEPVTTPVPNKCSEPSPSPEETLTIDGTNAQPSKKKKPGEMWIHEILEDLRTGKVLCNSDGCLPANVIVGRIPANKPVLV